MEIAHQQEHIGSRFERSGFSDRVRVMGLPIDRVTEEAAVNHILTRLRDGYGGWVATPNVDHLRMCESNLELLALVTSADLIIADGMPLVWASKLQGTPLPGRVCGSNLIFSLSEAAAAVGASIFLLGGNPGTADKAAAVLTEACPGLTIAGTLCPPWGFDKDEAQLAAVCDAICNAKPNIVYCCFGCPKQELLIQRFKKILPASWFLGVGGSLSMVCGEIKRAPLWMQRTGLEWVWRLLKEPRRLATRYLAHDLPFAVRLLWSARRQRFVSSESSETPRRTTIELPPASAQSFSD